MPCDLLDASRDDLAALAVRYGGRPFAGAQLYEWLYRRGETDVARMTNLPRAFRETLARETVATRLAVIDEQIAADGTRKFLFRLPAGEAVETVLIAMGDERRTLCISTQVGCAMGCRFCRTATMGFVRNLRQAEILAQVLTVRRHVPFTNIVLMGMGEPLHNYDAVVAALRILIDPKGLGFSKRHVTLSTVGLAPAIRRLADEGLGIKLALSLHATTDAQRAALIPVARRYPLAEVIEA
ncbi:MAG: 23S rRNA (adenine(2503)-C(2))-methyltransferase RlmN, partial [Deltaproteobacteria bacterium]|nr:23S rRNA (adenine(2503)-C(2))-methyltransferase RlmN [Deltaproteobacteria bacterium]